MADNTNQQNSADIGMSNDKDIEYQFNALGKPPLARDNFSMPGHKTNYDVAAAKQSVSNRYQAQQAGINAERAAQRTRDMRNAQPQHSSIPTVSRVTKNKKG